MSDHGVVMYAVVVNKKFWDGLPPDIRKNLNIILNHSFAILHTKD